jgi:hypothetical protein
MQYRVEMRDRLGRITAISDEIIGPDSATDYQRLAKRNFLNFRAPRGMPHYTAMSWLEIARSAAIPACT